MDHPFIKSTKLLVIYISMWVLLTIIHFSVLYFYYSVEITPVIIDSLLFNITFAILGWGLVIVLTVSLVLILTGNIKIKKRK